MPMGGLLYLRVPDALSETALADLRARFVSELGLNIDDDLLPLELEADPRFLPDPTSHWYEADLGMPYYGRGYERGDLPLFVRCAEWLEAAVPDGEVWYGDDCTEESIRPFGPESRAELLVYYEQVGHEPYDARFRQRKEG